MVEKATVDRTGARLLLLVCALAVAGCGGEQSRRPNVVLVIGDDHAWSDYGFMGSPVAHTPNLDALARDGVVYTRAFNTSSQCRASLLSLLTGLDPLQVETRVEALRAAGRDTLRFEEVRHFETLPGRLATRGYVSFQGGKYWDGTYADGGFSHGMTAQVGPDTGLHVGLSFAGAAGLTLGRETMQPLWDFIDGRADEPFFIWFAPMLPHKPFDAGEEDLAPYVDAELSEDARGYYANVTRFDTRVGELLSGLELRGLRDDTLVVYLSDNGWQIEAADATPQSSPRERFPDGARGKFTIYELGFRTPLILSWPGVLAGGSRFRDLVSSIDLVATILDAAGAEPLSGQAGRSLLPMLLHGEAAPRHGIFAGMRRILDEAYEGLGGFRGQGRDRYSTMGSDERVWFARDDQWSFVWYQDRGREELFRIEEDPLQAHDVLAEHRQVAVRLRRALKAWIAGMRASASSLAPPAELEEAS